MTVSRRLTGTVITLLCLAAVAAFAAEETPATTMQQSPVLLREPALQRHLRGDAGRRRELWQHPQLSQQPQQRGQGLLRQHHHPGRLEPGGVRSLDVGGRSNAPWTPPRFRGMSRAPTGSNIKRTAVPARIVRGAPGRSCRESIVCRAAASVGLGPRCPSHRRRPPSEGIQLTRRGGPSRATGGIGRQSRSQRLRKRDLLAALQGVSGRRRPGRGHPRRATGAGISRATKHSPTRKRQRCSSDFLAYEKNLLKVRTTYAKKMQKVLPAAIVARFFQIENKMDTIIEYEMAGEVPLINT